MSDHQIRLVDPGVPTRIELEDQLCAALDRADDLESLVRWLALPYMTTSVDGQPTVKTPIFADKNIYTGEDLITGPRLQALWTELFGDGQPASPGRWVRCESCNAYNIETVDYQPGQPLTDQERAAGLDLLRMGYLRP